MKKSLVLIIADANSGNQQALNKLLNLFWKDIYNFLSSKGLSEDDAEDLTVLTFTKAFDKINLYDQERDFKTWLLAIAQNNYIDLLRKNNSLITAFANLKSGEKLAEMAQQIPDLDTPEAQMIYKQDIGELKNRLNHLKPKYRIALELRYIEGLSIQGIAEQLGISISNAKIRLMRGRKLLFTDDFLNQ